MRREKMLQSVQAIEGQKRVTIRYANLALQKQARTVSFFKKPRRQFQRNIIDHLGDVLGIEKGRQKGEYYCWKERVDAMDWRLWCLYPYLDIKV
ncbi:hypothetical protein PHISCL_09159 [Aspergillus sclerotialis]|uniref:Uncharacterized protein n=1 Tax=Aspergillus sclerotialis TaxID=2070753 RepID=A0A3A2Z6N5_9EURO|nr:hypothetical protein PHISCL_09159 [Aspergillus sclerotialis]